MPNDRFFEELEALRLHTAESLREQHRPLTEVHLARLARRTRDLLGSVPGMNEAIGQALFDRLSEEDKNTIEALQFVTYGLAYISSLPEVQRSPVVTKVMEAIHTSVAELMIFDTDEESILKAFGAPALSLKNTRIAKKLRSDKENIEKAKDLFLKWENNPDLYKTKTAFARDCIRKEYCDTERTVFEWLSRFSKNMQAGHPLQAKIGKLKA